MVTPVSSQTFVEGLRRLADVLEKFGLSKVFPEPPIVAFKQPNSLRSLCLHAEISKPNTTIGKSLSCGDKRCKCCRHIQHSSSYTSKVTGKQYKIFGTVNCKSANIIYILECSSVASTTLASLGSPSTNI